MSGDFSPDQKRYLEGFVSGLNAARATRGVLPGGSAKGEPAGPVAPQVKRAEVGQRRREQGHRQRPDRGIGGGGEVVHDGPLDQRDGDPHRADHQGPAEGENHVARVAPAVPGKPRHPAALARAGARCAGWAWCMISAGPHPTAPLC